MKRIIFPIVVFSVAVLAGHAAISQEAGHEVVQDAGQEPVREPVQDAAVESAPEAAPSQDESIESDGSGESAGGEANSDAESAAGGDSDGAAHKSDADKAFGRDPRPKIDAFYSKHVDIGFQLATMFQYSNDSDFDRSKPLDDPYDRSTGLFGTFLKPQLTVKLNKVFRFYWELELGLDLWSRNSPDATLGADGKAKEPESFGIRQRELYGEVLYRQLAVRLGYQHIEDVSGLFLNHWFGAAAFRYGPERSSHLRLFGGQMPDQTYEGWDLTENSLKNDVYIAGIDGQWVFNRWAKIQAGAYYLGDLSTVGQYRHVGVLSAGFALEKKCWDARLAVIGQVGSLENSASDGGDALHGAWGVVASGGVNLKHFELKASGTVLSGDDDSNGNDQLAFMWSGKRPGMSILLSENESRDLGNNFDERIASRDGGFNTTVAGMGALDLGLYYKPVDYMKLGFVTAALFVLNPSNALGGSFVGSENELVFDAELMHDLIRIQAIAGLIVPGAAGAALVNSIDLKARDNIYFGQLAVILNF